MAFTPSMTAVGKATFLQRVEIPVNRVAGMLLPFENGSNLRCHAAQVTKGLASLYLALSYLISRADICLKESVRAEGASLSGHRRNPVAMTIIDEVERL